MNNFNWQKVIISFIIFMVAGSFIDYFVYSKILIIKNLILATVLSLVLELFERRNKK